jgi:beta-galactosidase
MFRDDPQVHIIGHWNYSLGTKKTIYITSNCSNVELFVNGKSLGFGEKSTHYLFTFKDVAFSPGEIKAVASDNGQPLATDSIRTAGPPVALRLSSIMGPGGLQADGSDIALIDVEAVDANGERCPTFSQRVNFSCAGPAIWRGGYDSGKENSINQKSLDLECGLNRVAVRSTLASGEISVTATCPGLKAARTLIPSHRLAVSGGYSRVMPAMPLVALSKTPPDWSILAAATPPITVTTASADSLANRRFIDTFNYTGPTGLVHIESNAANGKNVYCDRDYAFQGLPSKLTGADWVQAADADKFYPAVDLMQLAVKAGATVYVAYDASLPSPDWLDRQLRPTNSSLMIAGRPMKVFVRHLKNDESLTFGSNAEDSKNRPCNMYVVFVKPGELDNTASR